MDSVVFTVSGFDITWVELVLCGLVVLSAAALYFRFRNVAFYDASSSRKNKAVQAIFRFRMAMALVFLVSVLSLRLLHYDIALFELGGYSIQLTHLVELGSLFFVALFLDWVISHIVIRNRYYKREQPIKKTDPSEPKDEGTATQRVRYIVYLYVAQIMLQRLYLDAILFQRDIKGELFTVHISDVLSAVMILLAAQVLVWFVIQVTLYRMYRHNDTDEGLQYAVNQIVTYVIYVIAIIVALDRVVSDMSIVYGGAAALLVGVGLGLQQTFNDFFSGLILLFERSVMVGDILEFDGQVGKITKIGLRASRIETAGSVTMLVPNSKLVNQAVTNWTGVDDTVRFDLSVPVPFGSDTNQVRDILMTVVRDHPAVLRSPEPYVRLVSFTDTGFSLCVYFYLNSPLEGDAVKSDVRFRIEEECRIKKIGLGLLSHESASGKYS